MKKQKKKKKFFKKFFLFIFINIGLFILGHVVLYAYCVTTPKMSINKSKSYYLYDDNEELVFNDKDWISLSEMSANVVMTTVALEDKNFYKHMGFDYIRIVKALLTNIVSGTKKEGASTITQQYARNLFLNFDKTYDRKAEEALLAFELETHYSKDEILEGYLNTINYGGVFGIENAARYYFGKSAKELSLAEATMLVGIPKSPSNYSPFVNEEVANSRQKYILKYLYDNKIISEAEYNSAREEKLVYVDTEEKKIVSSLMYYQDAVIEEMKSITSVPASLLKTGGLRIYTTIDIETQNKLDESTKKNMVKNDMQVAAMLMDPNNGNILALTGGRDYYSSQFNRAISAKRQVGSSIKPFLYYSALENGFTSSSTFTSEKTIFTFSGDKTFAPKNYNDKYPNSPISMATAIAYSDNIYAVKTHLFLGEEVLIDIARRVGITSKLEAVPSLAIGSVEIGMTEMLTAYATFANEGYKVKPHLIERIEDSNGTVLYQFNETRENVLNRSLTYIMSELLTSTYDAAFIDYNYPTVFSMFPEMTKKYSIKTGTTDTDSWILGYNKNAVMAVWNGYDDNKDIPSDANTWNKQIWLEVMENYLNDKDNTWYKIPSNVVGVLVNPLTGKPATDIDKRTKVFYYIKGTEPYYDGADLDEVFKNDEKDE